ncbi:hypothetical protein QTH89_24925 [Variovorax sp. J22G21]|uniref:hypothetical protein n=1 Tax=Variovorax fucosicus TaxID=3053517 RepID=UPI002575C18D|nr:MULTISPECIES: hypothetical protein [unclassified Variovorax]MDM0039709.1 hypothetical protein [Variovorax sp. J22R193]MDM0064484.1 hypothetical protein [Variovorax sp. J22G21]
MHTELWPPLSLIRDAFEPSQPAAPGQQPIAPPRGSGSDAAPQRAAQDLLLPLTELARRREAVAQRAFPARWAPGRLVSLVHEGRLLGVLLDKCIGGDRWQGWMAAGEADWAGAFDVLLEPGDEPFEPLFGMVQAWNPLTLTPAPQLCARVLGELSATRLAAIRAVHDEWMAQQALAIDPAPGQIALRTAGGVFTVLSGTPLGADDPRADYQALYRDAAARLGASLQAAPAASDPVKATQANTGNGWGAQLRRWLAADRLVRPAFAVLALVVVVQNVGLLNRGSDDEEVRFRSVPVAPVVAPAELVVLWKPGVGLEDAGRLLRLASAEPVGGPDAQGAWRLRAADAPAARAVLEASPLVASVRPAETSGAR